MERIPLFPAPELNSDLPDPGNSQARNNGKELSTEQPAMRAGGKDGTAYVAARSSSKQPCSEAQGGGAVKSLESPFKSFPKLYMEPPLCTESLA